MEQSSGEKLGDGIDYNPTKLNIVRATMEVLHVPRRWFFSTDRSRQYTVARQIAAYVCRKYGISYPKTAAAIGYKDHTTAIYAARAIAERVESGDDWVIRKVKEIDDRARLFRQNDLQEIGKWVASRGGGEP